MDKREAAKLICATKQKFITSAKAHESAGQFSRRKKKARWAAKEIRKFKAYHCTVCGFYHLATANYGD